MLGVSRAPQGGQGVCEGARRQNTAQRLVLLSSECAPSQPGALQGRLQASPCESLSQPGGREVGTATVPTHSEHRASTTKPPHPARLCPSIKVTPVSPLFPLFL